MRAGQWLLVAEGLETTLSVMRACALPGWAALSAGGIKSLVLPPSANMIMICADNDANGVGQRAANAAAERFLAEGRREQPCRLIKARFARSSNRPRK